MKDVLGQGLAENFAAAATASGPAAQLECALDETDTNASVSYTIVCSL